MKILNTHEEYLDSKMSGQDCTTVAGFIAPTAVQECERAFGVLQLDRNGIVLSQIQIDADRRCKVTGIQQFDSTELVSILSYDYLQDPRTQAWWKSVFYEQDNHYDYDSFYNSLKVSDLVMSDDTSGSPVTFEALLTQLRPIVENWPKTQAYERMYVCGDYSCPMLLFLAQERWECAAVPVVLPQETDDFQEIQTAQIPISWLASRPLHISWSDARLSQLTKEAMSISIPINEMNLDSLVTDDCTWRQLLSANAVSPDYSTNQYEYKMLTLELDYNIYGDVFLVATDLLNNRIVHQIA